MELPVLSKNGQIPRDESVFPYIELLGMIPLQFHAMGTDTSCTSEFKAWSGKMTAPRRTNPDFLNGVPEMLLLRLLRKRPQYGYELVQSIRNGSTGVLEFGEGSIYPILHRLEAQGYLRSRREVVAGRKRVVYRITRQGIARLDGSVSRWMEVVRAVTSLLEGGADGLRPVAGSAG